MLKDELTRDEVSKIVFALDELLKKWESMQIDIDDSWFVLKQKFERLFEV